jgi:hypothetical protein
MRVNTSKFRKNPEPIDIYYPDTDENKVAILYKDKEIQFTGKDAIKVKSLIKTEYPKFWNSKILQNQYPANRDKAGGFFLYMSEILKNEYPKYFR